MRLRFLPSTNPQESHFKRQALTLFFIISLMPALTVSALWYTFTRDQNGHFITIGNFAAPIAILGLAPAIALSLLFAELLSNPIKAIHRAITQIAVGNLNYRVKFHQGGEFKEMADGLNNIASSLQLTLSESQTEYDLVAAERRKLRAILDTMNDGVIALDRDQRIIMFNKAASDMTGKSVATVAGQHYERALPFALNGQPILKDWLNNPHAAERMSWQNTQLLTDSEHHLVVDVSASQVKDDPNGITTLITFYDRTKEQELEEMKVDFVALAAHELRTPLSAIRGYLDILNTEAAPKMSRSDRDFLRRSMTETRLLAGLVDNLLNVSKIEHGEINFDFSLVDWPSFMNDSLKDLLQEAAKQGRKITLKTPKRLPPVWIDSIAMGEVLTNLVQNAIEHTVEHGKIVITSKLAGKEIETTVKDDGTGIPKDAIPKLFTKFYRVEGMRGGRGTGLGLYLSRSILDAHHGYIWVDSELGKGSTFGFNLPTADAVANPSSPDNNKITVMKGAHGWLKEDPNN